MSIHAFAKTDSGQRWFVALRESLAARLETLRIQNDRNKSPEETAFLRGQIAEIKALLADMGDKPNPTIAPRRNPYN